MPPTSVFTGTPLRTAICQVTPADMCIISPSDDKGAELCSLHYISQAIEQFRDAHDGTYPCPRDKAEMLKRYSEFVQICAKVNVNTQTNTNNKSSLYVDCKGLKP